MRQIFYYKIRQKFIIKCVGFFITKYDIYYKLRQYTDQFSLSTPPENIRKPKREVNMEWAIAIYYIGFYL